MRDERQLGMRPLTPTEIDQLNYLVKNKGITVSADRGYRPLCGAADQANRVTRRGVQRGLGCSHLLKLALHACLV